MKTKYDWSKFPKWANFAFTDDCGYVWGCDNPPSVDVGIDGGFCGNPTSDKWDVICKIGFDLDWRNSLEERPNV